MNMSTQTPRWKKKGGKPLTKATFTFKAWRLHRLWTGDMPHIPTQQGHSVTNWWLARVCVCVCVCVCEHKNCVWQRRNTTDACGFPPGPQTLTSLSPKCKHKTKCLAQNKQATRAEGVSPMIELKSSHPTYTHTACKLQNHMLDWATTFERQVQ